MPITINGSGTVTGISAGGLPDGCVVTADVADGAITQQKRSEQLTLATAQATTSGTSIDFTGIPSWAKRITVMFNGVSTNGISNLVVRIGSSSGIQTTGYGASSVSSSDGVSPTAATYTTGFGILSTTASNVSHGAFVLNHLGSNTWTFNGSFGRSNSASVVTSAGSATLSGTLDRIRITTVNGTDTFDAGSINIMYE